MLNKYLGKKSKTELIGDLRVVLVAFGVCVFMYGFVVGAYLEMFSLI